MPTVIRRSVSIGAGEHLIRFLNLSGDEVLLEPVTVAPAESVTETVTPDEAVASLRPRQGSRFAETVSLSDLTDTTVVFQGDVARWGIGVWGVSLWGGPYSVAEAAPGEATQGFLLLQGKALTESLAASETIDSDRTNVEGLFAVDALVADDAEAAARATRDEQGESVAAGEAANCRVESRKKSRSVIYRWGW